MSDKFDDCGVMITTVRISNFRSLENIEVDLDNFSVLVGANNSGKTSFLDAIYSAIGASRRLLGKEDIHLKKNETDVPLARTVVIDILLRPYNHGRVINTFTSGSFWTKLWGKGITQDNNLADMVGIRTTQVWSPTQGEYRIERNFLKEWLPFDQWLAAQKMDSSVTSSQLEAIALYYMDAKRDIEDDLRTKGSFWNRLTNDLGLATNDVLDIEQILNDLNQKIIAKSDVLKHVHENLIRMDSVVIAEKSGIAITPVARRLRDLAKGIDISFATANAQSFPLSRHGMGTRSLASVLVFRAFVSWKMEQAQKKASQVHPILAMEEPETHLHPQAQRALFNQIKNIPGQRIISTHSPFFAGQAKLDDFILFQKTDNSSVVSRLDTQNLADDQRRKLEKQIMQTRGDILFCRALILFEGQTEELALPIFAQAYWNANIFELGFNFIPVGGRDYYPYIWFAENFNIKWYIFSDGEAETIIKINQSIKKYVHINYDQMPNIFVLPNGHNLERYYIAENYLPEIEQVLQSEKWSSNNLDDYINKLDGKEKKKMVVRNYKTPDGRQNAALDALSENKTNLAIPIAEAITKIATERRFPDKIAQLLAKISKDFNLEVIAK